MLLNPVKILREQIEIPQSFSIDELNENLKYLSGLKKSQLQELQRKQAMLVLKIYWEPNIDSLYHQL